jgi:hypothetical protein
VVVGVQESKGYGIGFGIPTLAFGVAIAAFIIGAVFKLYVKVPPEGSPFTRIWHVLKGEAGVVEGGGAGCCGVCVAGERGALGVKGVAQQVAACSCDCH